MLGPSGVPDEARAGFPVPLAHRVDPSPRASLWICICAGSGGLWEGLLIVSWRILINGSSPSTEFAVFSS